MQIKTLYVSDLDGTLLTPTAKLSDYTKAELNRLTSDGMDITIATARTQSTVTGIMEGVNLSLPYALMNGAVIYDNTNHKYLSTEKIDETALSAIIKILKEQNVAGFFFEIVNDECVTLYYNDDTEFVKNYIIKRRALCGVESIKKISLQDITNRNIVYFSLCDTVDRQSRLHNELKKLPLLHLEFYKDTYINDGYYVEIASIKANKKNAIEKIKKMFGYDKIISFGDNNNDLPMFAISDECYAVDNANEAVKLAASGVIASNVDDGVVKWLAERNNYTIAANSK